MRQRLLWPRLTSRSTGGLRSAVPASPVQAQGEISQGKARDFRSIYPPHLRPLGPGGFRASGLVAPSPTSRSPLMRFVFLGPELCLRLPSRVSSRSYGCRSARGSQPPGPPGDSHPLVTSRSAFASRLPLRVPAETRHAWRTTERRPPSFRRYWRRDTIRNRMSKPSRPFRFCRSSQSDVEWKNVDRLFTAKCARPPPQPDRLNRAL